VFDNIIYISNLFKSSLLVTTMKALSCSWYCSRSDHLNSIVICYFNHAFLWWNFLFFSSLKPDDVAIYFRWLVVHLHSTKKICNYLKLLQWLPVIHRNNIELQLAAPVHSPSDTSYSKSSEWQDRLKPTVTHIPGFIFDRDVEHNYYLLAVWL